MNYLKERFNKLIKNKYNLSFFVLSIFVGLASLALFRSEQSYHLLNEVRILFCIILLPAIFFAGSDGIFYTFYIYAQIIFWLHDYTDYVSFIITAIFVMIKPKWKLPALAIYLINVICIAQFRHKDAAHIIIHLLNCTAILFTMLFFVKQKTNRPPLELTDRQQNILEQLASGKLQKEITCCSKNTITQDLRKAMNNNNCATKEELLSVFIQQNK